MAGLVAGAAKLIGRPVALNSKCVSFCFIRHLSAESSKNEKPKKPATHFLLYLHNIRNDLDRNNPGIKVVEKVKIASQMYKDITDEDRQKIKEQSVKLLEDYKEKMQKWRASLSAEEKDEIKSEKEKKNKRKIKKLQKANNMPKGHVSAYTLYVSDQLKSVNLQSMTSSEKMAAVRKNMSVCAEKWKTMSEKDKEVFTVLAEEAKTKYEKDMWKWEQSMLEDGKRNLVRKSTLRKQEVAENKTKREAARAAKSAKKKVKTKKTKSAGKKKTVSKKSKVKSAVASRSAKGRKSTQKKKVHFEDSESKTTITTKKDFYSSDSE